MVRCLRGVAAALGAVLVAAAPVLPQGSPGVSHEPGPPGRVRTGLDLFLESPPDVVRGKRIGLITNPSGVDSRLRSTIDLLAGRQDMSLMVLFGPEHGIQGHEVGAVPDGRDPKTGLPVYSLYGDTQRPTPEMLQDLDALIFDIQDIGTRFYTYTSTLALAMQAAAAAKIPFVVLDRPNPLGGEVVDGPVLDPQWSSFIGMYPLPILHGMTVGELARLFNTEYGIGADLTVVPMRGWRRGMWFDDTGLPWVMTSPHIPRFQTAALYPALGPIGDTGLTVGVETTKPFEFVGDVYVEPWRLRSMLEARHPGGVAFREVYWRGEPWTDSGGPEYAGVEIRVTDRRAYRPVDLMLHILDVMRLLYPSQFQWGELSGDRYLFDLEMGTDQVRQGLIAGKTPKEIEKAWESGLAVFLEVRKKYLLYP